MCFLVDVEDEPCPLITAKPNSIQHCQNRKALLSQVKDLSAKLSWGVRDNWFRMCTGKNSSLSCRPSALNNSCNNTQDLLSVTEASLYEALPLTKYELFALGQGPFRYGKDVSLSYETVRQ